MNDNGNGQHTNNVECYCYKGWKHLFRSWKRRILNLSGYIHVIRMEQFAVIAQVANLPVV